MPHSARELAGTYKSTIVAKVTVQCVVSRTYMVQRSSKSGRSGVESIITEGGGYLGTHKSSAWRVLVRCAPLEALGPCSVLRSDQGVLSPFAGEPHN